MKKKVIFMLISATLLTACSTNNATSGADGGLKGATFGLKAVHPDNYVEAGFRTLSLPNSLTSNLNIDLTKFNFSNTQIAALPFADSFLDSAGYIRPDRIPQVEVVEAQSLVEINDENMAYYASLYNADFPQDIPFAQEAFKLNFTNKYIYNIEIPSVGYVGHADVSTQYITNTSNNQDVYYDSPTLYYLDDPITYSAMSKIPKIPLKSLPSSMQRNNIKALHQDVKLYWFPNNNIKGTSWNYVIQVGQNTFKDIYTVQEFSFVAEKTNSLEHERRITLNFNGQTGYMVEQSSPPVGQVNSDCV